MQETSRRPLVSDAPGRLSAPHWKKRLALALMDNDLNLPHFLCIARFRTRKCSMSFPVHVNCLDKQDGTARIGMLMRETAMGSFNRPKHSYTSEELDELQWVFDSVWSTVQARYTQRDKTSDEKLKGALRRKLFAVACTGTTNREMLATVLLDSIPLSPGMPVPLLARRRRRSSL
jgi:hypothetical protein